MLSLGFGEPAIVDAGGAVDSEGAVLDFLPCKGGRLAFLSFRTEGALICRLNGEGMTVELLDDAVLSFG